ncbi:hypothetical protein Pmani_035467 [Petrolisthes manimaculis]|uniref:Uncharacterized protein n=1 Tax=Petrolisthes manimaculis TaxID=1843537 RepID=A0AAE1NMA6_9EUCA|nr:hypothetical protein Pmani_035467 [Petrolisthes manimaculis]
MNGRIEKGEIIETREEEGERINITQLAQTSERREGGSGEKEGVEGARNGNGVALSRFVFPPQLQFTKFGIEVGVGVGGIGGDEGKSGGGERGGGEWREGEGGIRKNADYENGLKTRLCRTTTITTPKVRVPIEGETQFKQQQNWSERPVPISATESTPSLFIQIFPTMLRLDDIFHSLILLQGAAGLVWEKIYRL